MRRQRRPHLPRPPRDAAGQVVEQMVAEPERVEADVLRGPSHRRAAPATRPGARPPGAGRPHATVGSSRTPFWSERFQVFAARSLEGPLTVTREPRNDERSWGPGFSLAARVSRMPCRRPRSCRRRQGPGRTSAPTPADRAPRGRVSRSTRRSARPCSRTASTCRPRHRRSSPRRQSDAVRPILDDIKGRVRQLLASGVLTWRRWPDASTGGRAGSRWVGSAAAPDDRKVSRCDP